MAEKDNKELKKKRRVGRPKKRGPKKKRKSRAKPKPKVYKPRPKWDWKIVTACNGRQKEYIGRYHRITDAYEELNRRRKMNESIVFPKKVMNSYRLQNCNDECLLLEKNRYGDKDNTRLRNEYGVLVEQITTNKKWIILDKIPYYREETFWVYGFDPKTDRKEFMWILENVVEGKITSQYDIKRIIVYKNKLIIKSDNGPFDMVICKNVSDTIRFYNLLHEKLEKSRFNKQFVFLGSYDRISPKRKGLEKEIMAQTGWSLEKIQLNSTRA